jgi:hypothetical protein
MNVKVLLRSAILGLIVPAFAACAPTQVSVVSEGRISPGAAQ